MVFEEGGKFSLSQTQLEDGEWLFFGGDDEYEFADGNTIHLTITNLLGVTSIQILDVSISENTLTLKDVVADESYQFARVK